MRVKLALNLLVFLWNCLFVTKALTPGKHAFAAERVWEVFEAEPHENITESEFGTVPNYVGHLPQQMRLQLCKEALTDRYFKDKEYKIINSTVEDEKKYRLDYFGGYYGLDKKSIIVWAFKCPTQPPIYLRQGHNWKTIYVVVGERPED